MDLKDVGTVVALVGTVGGGFLAYGKLVQEMRDNQKANDKKFLETDKKFEGFAKMHDEHFRLGRDHDQRDQEHFRDGEVHTSNVERGWISRTFQALEKRFDDQDKMLRELLQRIKSPS